MFAANRKLNSADSSNVDTEVDLFALNLARTLLCETDLERVKETLYGSHLTVSVSIQYDGREVAKKETGFFTALQNDDAREIAESLA